MNEEVSMQYVSCNLCGCRSSKKRFEKEGYTIVECTNCDFVYVNPRPNDVEIENLYDEEYYKGGGFDSFNELFVRHEKQASATALRWFAELKMIEFIYGRRGKILDVGCAFGDFLNVARDMGWDVFGNEISPFAYKYLVADFGVNKISRIPIDKGAEFEEKSFDVIMMTEVIEHVCDPRQTLAHVNRLLKEGGLLVVETSDVTARKAKRKGVAWKYLIPPGHLNYFSRKTLRQLLEETGFSVAKYFQGGHTGPVKILRKLKLIEKDTMRLHGLARATYAVILAMYEIVASLIGYESMTFYAVKKHATKDDAVIGTEKYEFKDVG